MRQSHWILRIVFEFDFYLDLKLAPALFSHFKRKMVNDCSLLIFQSQTALILTKALVECEGYTFNEGRQVFSIHASNIC